MGALYVALGAALGAVLRYWISLLPFKSAFPLPTLIVNLVGALAIGFIVGLAESGRELSARAALFYKTGLCGGFTTFSTFSLEACGMLEQKAYISAGIYIVFSILGCMLGVACGKKLALLLR